MTSYSGDSLTTLQSEAALAVAKGDDEKALELFRAAGRLDWRNPMHALRAGDCLVRMGRVNEALPVYRRVAERYAAEGHHARAVSVYRLVQRLFPRDTVAARRLAELKRLHAHRSPPRDVSPVTAADVVEMFPVVIELDADVMEVSPTEHARMHAPAPVAAPPRLPAVWNEVEPRPTEVEALEQTVRYLLAELLRTQCELDALKAKVDGAAAQSTV